MCCHAKVDRDLFIKIFKGNEVSPDFFEKMREKANKPMLDKYMADIKRAQTKVAAVLEATGMSYIQLKQLQKDLNKGTANPSRLNVTWSKPTFDW